MWREYCRRLVHWRKQSVEMCDLYSAASNAFVLFRSYTGSASLSLSLLFLPPSNALSLPAATRLVRRDLKSTDHFRCSSARLQPPSGIFPVPSFHSIRSFPACFTLLVSSSQSVNKTTYKWILLLALKLWWISPIELGHTFFRSRWTVSQFIAKLQRYL